MIKLIVFDMDGTLLKHDKTVSSETIKTINQLKSMGIKLTIASGRAEPLIFPYALMLEIKEYVLINNGTTIKNLHENYVLINHTIDEASYTHVMDTVIKENIAFTVNSEGIFYTNSLARKAFYDRWNQDHYDSLIHYKFITDLKDVQSLKAEKILLIIDDTAAIERYENRFKAYSNIHITKSQNNFLDIMPKGVNKGSALKLIATHYGLDMDEIMVFGDHDNDAEMLKAAGISIAMPNGSVNAQKVANVIALDTNDHDGVRKTLEHFIEGGILRQI